MRVLVSSRRKSQTLRSLKAELFENYVESSLTCKLSVIAWQQPKPLTPSSNNNKDAGMSSRAFVNAVSLFAPILVANACLPTHALAADDPLGSLARNTFGDQLERDYGIKLYGWAQAESSTTTTHPTM